MAQSIIILAIAVILLIYLVVIRPWKLFLLNVFEIIMQLIYIAIVVCFLIMAISDNKGCFDCNDRENSLCWIIIYLILALFAFGLLGLASGLLY